MRRLLRRILRRLPREEVEPVKFDHVAGRRAAARAYMRSRGITHVKGLYGAPRAQS